MTVYFNKLYEDFCLLNQPELEPQKKQSQIKSLALRCFSLLSLAATAIYFIKNVTLLQGSQIAACTLLAKVSLIIIIPLTILDIENISTPVVSRNKRSSSTDDIEDADANDCHLNNCEEIDKISKPQIVSGRELHDISPKRNPKSCPRSVRRRPSALKRRISKQNLLSAKQVYIADIAETSPKRTNKQQKKELPIYPDVVEQLPSILQSENNLPQESTTPLISSILEVLTSIFKDVKSVYDLISTKEQKNIDAHHSVLISIFKDVKSVYDSISTKEQKNIDIHYSIEKGIQIASIALRVLGLYMAITAPFYLLAKISVVQASFFSSLVFTTKAVVYAIASRDFFYAGQNMFKSEHSVLENTIVQYLWLTFFKSSQVSSQVVIVPQPD